MKFRTTKKNVGPLSMRAALGSVSDEKRTVDVTFSTGAKVLRNSWFDGPSYEELSMDPAHVRMGRLQNGAPFLADHQANLGNVIGVVESARLENGKGIATVRFAKAEDDPRADQIFRKIRDGLITGVSVGYRTYKSEKVEGSDPKIPTMRATDWEPYEISAVALPADASAGFRSDEAQLNECNFISRSLETRMDPEELKRQEEAKKLDAQRAAEALKAGIEQALQVERARTAGIAHAVRVAKLSQEFADKLVADKVTLEKARELVIEEIAQRGDDTAIGINGTPMPSGIEVGEEDRDKWIMRATGATLSRSGLLPMLASVVAGVKSDKIVIPGVREHFKGFDSDNHGGELRSNSIFELARESLDRRGVNMRGWSKSRVMGEALTRAGGNATVSDFAVVLENVMYKTLLGSYALADDTWRRFCGTDSVQDFRPSNRYRTGSFGVLDLKQEGAEYQHKAIPDGIKMTISTQTYGDMIGVSREALINDDMGAILHTLNGFGRMAGLTIEKAVYALLAQNSGKGPTVTYNGSTAALCDDTAFGNVSTGAALSMAALEADRVKIAKLTDISGNEYLNLRPQTLLVPVGLEGEANLINRAKFDPTASSSFERPNIVGGLFRDVVGTPRLSGTARYLFTDPNAAAAILVVFLNGSQAPFMDQKIGWNVDGTEMKIRIDFKAQAFDPKGILFNAGV